MVFEKTPACLFRHPEHTLRAVLIGIFGVGPSILPRPLHQKVVHLLERIRDVLQEDESQHHMLVLARVHVVAQLIGRLPQRGLKPDRCRGCLLCRFLLCHCYLLRAKTRIKIRRGLTGANVQHPAKRCAHSFST
jgi:hypothetical protein